MTDSETTTTPTPTLSTDLPSLAEQVAATPVWYHTMELAPGLTTPGWFDLRPIVDRLPWPEVRGRRCLDVGTYDGFLAFELERRGAAEVVAVDIPGHEDWDWPADMRARGADALAAIAGPKGRGFDIARQALASRVERVPMSVYELSPERIGTFDVVVCGSLMLHLRDPIRALEAVRSVCGGVFLSAEAIDLRLTVMARRRPVAHLNGVGELCQWWTPNAEGHRQMLRSAGFAIERTTRPYSIPFGAGHSPRGRDLRTRAELLFQRLAAGNPGVPHSAALARPAI